MRSLEPKLRERENGREGRISGWAKATRAMKKEDQIYALKQAEMAKKHPGEAFYALDDQLEAVGI
jgi:hypothetical protein